MNVVSLFDGISCGRVALDRAGVPVEKYYASEVDKHATAVSQDNYPDIVRLGDVEAWRTWGVDWANIDLLIGGSPCQGFSFAGKQLNFNDPRSALFFVFLDVLEYARTFNPDIKFLLENVRMKREYLDKITDMLGVEPVCINSALVSAQNRVRYYWANWHIPQPMDKGLVLRDIITDTPEGWKLGTAQRPRGNNAGGLHPEKAPTITSNSWEHNNKLVRIGATGQQGYEQDCRVYDVGEKCPTLLANSGGNKAKNIGILCNTNPSGRGMNGQVANIHGKCPTLTTNKGEGSKVGELCSAGWHKWWEKSASFQKEKKYSQVCSENDKALTLTARMYANWNGNFVVVGCAVRGRYAEGGEQTSQKLELHADEKSNAVTTVQKDSMISMEATQQVVYRKLTPIECERLQTLPDDYTCCVSNSQRYKQLGNGWTVDVVSHIFRQLTLN